MVVERDFFISDCVRLKLLTLHQLHRQTRTHTVTFQGVHYGISYRFSYHEF